MTPLRTKWGKRGSLGFHLYLKEPKLVKKWLFSPERLRDSIGNHMGQKGDPWLFLLYQKDPKSVKKWLIYDNCPIKRLCDSIENNMEQKGNTWVFVCTKMIQNWSRNG